MAIEKMYEVVGRLVVNPRFRDAFFDNPKRAVTEFNVSGLLETEIDELKLLDKERVKAAGYALDHFWIVLMFFEDRTLPDIKDKVAEYREQLGELLKRALKKR